MEIVYRRPGRGTHRYSQELLHDGGRLKITLLRRPARGPEREVGNVVTLDPGAPLLWFTFPGRGYEVGAFHRPAGELLGHYTNVIRPPRLAGGRWEITDLFVDVWQPAEAPDDPRLLDREQLRRARAEGVVPPEEADRADELARGIAERARAGAWPPSEVARWPLEAVPALRLRRDEPGIYYANKVSGRIIAFGIYMLGAVSATSVVFAAATDALVSPGTARRWWLGALAVEAAALLPTALAGKLPATRRVRLPEAMDENTLFLGAAVTGAAVLLINDSTLWRSLLSSVYGALSLFLGVFAVCRAYFDRELPGTALAGLAVCVLALVALL